jgi:hypothetical protein
MRKKPEIRFPIMLWLAKPRIIPVTPPATRSADGSIPIKGRLKINTIVSVP